MTATLPNIRAVVNRTSRGEAAEAVAEPPKPPPDLNLFFMLSHLEQDGPVRLDGVKLAVSEVMGLELDEPKLGAFAGSLNALDFPVQLLVRQHPPVLATLRNNLMAAQPEDLPQQTRDAADSLGRLLGNLENREGILDRRFYAVCEHGRMDELHGLLARGGLGVFPLTGEPLRLFWLSATLGGSPQSSGMKKPKWKSRSTAERHPHRRPADPLPAPGQVAPVLGPRLPAGLMAAGAPMDLAVHLGAIPPSRRPAPWSGRRSASSRRNPCPSSGAGPCRLRRRSPWRTCRGLRDEVQRGRERLFHASLSVTLHADNADTLKDLTQKARAHFAATLGKLDNLSFRQREGLLSTLPLALNAVAVWRTLDTSSLARLFPFSPPDLDTRSGTLYGIDLRACAPIVYDPFDGTHLNANTAVLARSGSGKNPSPPSWACCGACLPGSAGLRHRPRGRVRRHGESRRRQGAVPRRPRPGHEPLRHRPGRQRGTPPAHRQPAPVD